MEPEVEEYLAVACPENRSGLPCFDSSCERKCKRRVMMKINQDDAVTLDFSDEQIEETIRYSCSIRGCEKRIGVEQTVTVGFCRSHSLTGTSGKCKLLREDHVCSLGTRYIVKKAGRLSFGIKEGVTLRQRWKSSGWTYRKVS